METKLEYLGEGTIEVTGVGTFGRERFERERKEWFRITTLPCPEQIAKQFEGDPKFKIHRPSVGVQNFEPLQTRETKKRKEG